MINRESGVLTTETQSVNGSVDGGDVTSCSRTAMGGRLLATFTFLVRGDSTHSTMEITPTYTKDASTGGFARTDF